MSRPNIELIECPYKCGDLIPQSASKVQEHYITTCKMNRNRANYNTKTGEESSESTQTRSSCPFCQKAMKFLSPGQITEHVEQCQKLLEKDQTEEAEDVESTDGKTICTKCNEVVEKAKLFIHLQIHCSKREMFCELCSEQIRADEKEKHDALECSYKKINCEYCQMEFPRKLLPVHEKTCPKKPTSSSTAGVEVKDLKYTDHKTICLQCNEAVENPKILIHLEKHCSKREISCQLCSQEMKADEKETHDASECTKKINCRYCQMGCFRYLLAVHEESCPKKPTSSITVTNKLEKEVEPFSRVKKLEKTVFYQKKEIDELKTRTSKFEEFFKMLLEERKEQQIKNNELQAHILQQQEEINKAKDDFAKLDLKFKRQNEEIQKYTIPFQKLLQKLENELKGEL